MRVSRGSRGRRRRPASGWDSLTDTERTVAALVAEGHSNPAIADLLFVSRRTVQWPHHPWSTLPRRDRPATFRSRAGRRSPGQGGRPRDS
ncbi:helix-turn-helix domain-containing protein [Streptomyces sp. NPDC054841]